MMKITAFENANEADFDLEILYLKSLHSQHIVDIIKEFKRLQSMTACGYGSAQQTDGESLSEF